MSIPPEVIEQVKERASFVEIASQYIKLKRSGKNFVGCCPFHSEKTGSFFINEDEGLFNCFGCGKKGSIFNFIMEMRGFSFPESVKYLASQVGIEIKEEESSEFSAQRKSLSQRLRNLLIAVSDIYTNKLLADKEAMDYLVSRGIKNETIRNFRLGYAPKQWEFIEEELSKVSEFSQMKREDLQGLLLQVGLLKPKTTEGENATKNSKFYDAFRERVIFPIMRSDGRPIAFGGRIISSQTNAPKYLNSSESILYSKRKSFYGLSQAIEHIRRERHVFITEGYLDVLSFVQVGIKNTLATCGTAVTEQHALILKRLADRVTIVFDADDAGVKAAAKCFEVFLNTGIDLEIVHLPDGHDPDSLAQKHTLDEIKAILANNSKIGAEVFIDYLFSTESSDERSPAVLGRLAKNFVEVVAKVKNPVEKEFLLKIAAEKFGTSVDSLSKLMNEGKEKYTTSTPINETYSSPSFEMPPEAPPMNFAAYDLRPQRVFTQERKTVGNKSSIKVLLKQLLVAVLSEPLLSQILLEEQTVANVIKDEARNLGPKIIAFINELVSLELDGVCAIVDRAKELNSEHKFLDISAAPELQNLLAKYNLGNFGLLEEAFRQVQFGKGAYKPDKIISESFDASSRFSLKSEVRIIKQKESNALAEDEKMKLAQEKLSKRRDLEQLNKKS
ncbi:MAG: DNA primase [Proteobacteria bacterium]|nr:DNA primase [Pseudomonadota bacterium]